MDTEAQGAGAANSRTLHDCKDCLWNDCGLCDMTGVLVTDDDMACKYWNNRRTGSELRHVGGEM